MTEHEGIWEGVYRHYNKNGELVDTHKSRLEINIDCNKWDQTNTYTWADGKTVSIKIPGFINSEGTLVLDNERLLGGAKTIVQDTVFVWWSYPGTENSATEIINMINPNHRMRVWQMIENNSAKGWVQIEERRTK